MKHIIYPVLLGILSLPVARYIHSNWHKICPIGLCIIPVVNCARTPDCRPALDCFGECDYEDSERRKQSMIKYSHVQFPHDPDLCRYGCLDMLTTPEGERLVECLGKSGCMAPSQYPDECAPIEQENVLPLSTIPKEVLQGEFTKLFTNSWDVWPCQRSEFFPPVDTTQPPRDWMKAWPNDPTVWRMDFNWTVLPAHVPEERREPYTFAMSNEMYPGQAWEFYETTSGSKPTLKTIAPMWGTEAHENWYLLHYDPKEQWFLIHVCAYTAEVNTYDAISIVFRKNGQHQRAELEDEVAAEMERIALEKLGKKFGTLLRIKECDIDTTF